MKKSGIVYAAEQEKAVQEADLQKILPSILLKVRSEMLVILNQKPRLMERLIAEASEAKERYPSEELHALIRKEVSPLDVRRLNILWDVLSRIFDGTYGQCLSLKCCGNGLVE